MTRIYLPSLDGLRFFAFFAVLLNHVVAPDSTWLQVLHTRGWVGVEMFFCLSAFLLFTLLRAEHERTGQVKVLDFFIRRILRIYPLMVGAPILFMAIGGALHNADAWEQWWYIASFRDNLLPDTTFNLSIPFGTHLWTLSYEFQVYAAIPVAFFLYLRFGRKKFIAMLLVGWLVSLAARFYFSSIPAPHPTIYFLPFLRPDSVLAGILISLLPQGYNRRYALLAIALVAIGVVWFFMTPNVYDTSPSNVFIYTAAALACGSALWLAINVPLVANALANPVLVYLGKRSFGLYVFHLLALWVVKAHILPIFESIITTPTGVYIFTLFCGVAVSIALAELSYTCFERYFLYLKDKKAVVFSRPV